MVPIIFLGIGISFRKANEAVGFFIFAKPPKIEDIQRYNNAVSTLWFVVAGMFELLGIPFLFSKQTTPVFILIILAVRILILAMIYVYYTIETKYQTR